MARKISVSAVGPKEDLSQLDEDSQNKVQEEIYKQLNVSPIKTGIMALTLMFLFGLSGMVYSLQAPFFPEEGRSKSMTGIENGFIFGVFALAGFIFSIPAGKISALIAPKLFTVLNGLLTGFSTITFGIVTYMQSKPLFFAVSTILRILQGVGVTGLSIGVMEILTTAFPKYSRTMLSTTETIYGVGLIIGPAIGGPLFDVGGFLLPFLVIGFITVLTCSPTCSVVPSDMELKLVSKYREADTRALCIFSNPKIWFGIFALTSGGMAMGYIEATLDLHLEVFHLSGTYTGLIFLLYGLGYGGSSPIWGWICDTGFSSLLCVCIGSMFITIGFLLVGPAPFLPLDQSLTLILPGLFVAAVGMGGCIPPSFVYMKKVALQLGLPGNVDANGMLAGIFMGGIFLGNFIGPLIGGFLYDLVGFPTGSMALSGFHAFIGVLVSLFI